MPYRRLPNTDKARFRALQIAFEKGKNLLPKDKPYSQSSLQNINMVLPKYGKLLKLQSEFYKSQIEKSSEYKYLYNKARNYVSHFFQVLNLAIIRGDLKKESRGFFGIDDNVKKLPDFKTELELMKWGELALKGEQERIGNGGNPMTNPTVAVVRVHYEKFKEAYRYQKNLQDNYARASKHVAEFRPEVDRVILQLWNDLEEHFSGSEEVLKRNHAREYGVVYFFRKNEEIPEQENVPAEKRLEKELENQRIEAENQLEEVFGEDDLEKDDLQYSLF